MPKEKPEGIVDDDAVGADEAEGDIQDQVLSELEAAEADVTRSILDAAGIEGGALFDDGDIDALLDADIEADVSKPKAKKVAKPKEEGGVRFKNLKEAEAETRKLQSERDRLLAENEKLKAGDPEVEQARAIIRDINSDPVLAAGIRHYFKDGKFSDESPAAEAGLGDTEFDFGGSADYGTMTKEQVNQLVDQRVEERLTQAQQMSARQAYFEAQKQALLEAYPGIDEDEWNDLIEFSKDPKGVTLTNLYKLKNLNREIEDRAKILAERMLRSRGAGTVRPSIGGAAGGGSDVEEEPQTQILRDILLAGRKESLLG